MKGDVKNLEIKMVARFRNEMKRPKERICDGFEAKMEADFTNDACDPTILFFFWKNL